MHYYEDGNVRMNTSKKVELGAASNADAIVREIVKAENGFQEQLNRSFTALSEGSFKGLRRQLPVTRQRVEWEKIGGYRVRPTIDGRSLSCWHANVSSQLGQDVAGGRQR